MAGVHRGREQALAELDMWREPFEDFRWDPREFIDAGLRESEWTWVVGGVMSARGRASGAETSVEEFHVWTISRGRALGLSMHLDRAEALATAGVVVDSPARESAHPAR